MDSSAATKCEVLIVGAGPAGLSAALFLARCRRQIRILDSGKPRNTVTKHSHGFFTRDGEAPSELLRIGREQLGHYGVEVEEDFVESVNRTLAGFEARTRAGSVIRARKVLLATGLSDDLPTVDGFRELYGKSVFACPCCDAWEFRDRALVAYRVREWRAPSA